MYKFTDTQKAALLDAGVTFNNVVDFHAISDNAWLSADEAFNILIEWYGDHSLQGCV